MLLSRAEMTFDFGGARLRPAEDRELLSFLLDNFLYGEVAANQIGEWLYDAPDLESARFLARQAVEELQHVDNFVRIMGLVGLEPGPAHRVVHFLVTGMKGASWPEHVGIVMAAGEGMVLMALYGLIDTLDHPESVEILKRAARQEERHVEFGEQQTMRVIAGRPAVRRRLLGLSLVTLWATRRLATAMRSRLPGGSPIMERLPAFAEAVARSHELRLSRMGLLDGPLDTLPRRRQLRLVAEAYLGRTLGLLASILTRPLRAVGLLPRRRLTDTYLGDPALRAPSSPSTPGSSG
jgi:hypothetical protein